MDPSRIYTPPRNNPTSYSSPPPTLASNLTPAFNSVSLQSPRSESKRKLNVDSPSFKPSFGNGFSNFTKSSPKLADIHTFIPQSLRLKGDKNDKSDKNSQFGSPKTKQKAKTFNVETPAFTPQSSSTNLTNISFNSATNSGRSASPSLVSADANLRSNITSSSRASTPAINANDYQNSYIQYNSSDMYYPQQSYPLQYHLYAPHPTQFLNLKPYQRSIQNLFIPDDLREDLQRKSEAILQVIPGSKLPDHVHTYHTLVPLDTSLEKKSNIFGFLTSLYKAFSNVDGKTYALRRLEGFRLTNEKAINTVQAWKAICSANVVDLHEAFTSVAFGDSSLICVYDYFPNSSTLYDLHYAKKSHTHKKTMIQEDVIWSYIVQINNAINIIHQGGLAARALSPTKIIVTSKNRIRLSSCGILDILQYSDSDDNIEELQQEDFMKFGRLILELALLNTGPAIQSKINAASGNIQAIVQLLPYSASLKEVLQYLSLPSTIKKSSTDLAAKMAPQIMNVLNKLQYSKDFTESALSTELENSRLVRLLTKMGIINERPEFDHDPSWSESGDRYLIKLFRDYVFHQEDEFGKPVINMTYILKQLNKLDAGLNEKIMLVSRDEQSCLIVSYKEIKDCMEKAFGDLSR